MRIANLERGPLSIPDWEIKPGETWCILGGNASGKGLLAAVLTGEMDPERGGLENGPESVRWVSFEQQRAFYEEELRNDDTDYMDRIDTGTTGIEVLLQSGCAKAAAIEEAEKLGIGYILDRGYRLLSSGEARKLMLLQALLSKPGLLLIDEPYEGLDAESRAAFDHIACTVAASGQAIILLVNRIDDIPAWVSHLALLQRGELIAAGPKDTVVSKPELRQIVEFNESSVPPLPPPPGPSESFDPLVAMRRCKVQYGDQVQFHEFTWELRPGEHTLITGPNGAGKSTLLQLISGDHPQCYCNDLKVFGYQRGTGESVWEIKRHIGLVSAALHRDYRAPGNAMTTVVSGFFDSIGLYQNPTAQQLKLASQWLEAVGLRKEANASFRQLSWGQQRLVLIARALIKQPPLLILDEPTQGLDDLNRHLVLAFIQRLADLKRTTVLFVSHREDERLPLFEKRVRFRRLSPEDTALYRAETI